MKSSINELYQDFLNIIFNWKFDLIALVVIAPFIFYVNYRLNVYLFNIRQERLRARESIQSQEKEIESFIGSKLDYLNSRELNDLLEMANQYIKVINRQKELFHLKPKIKSKVKEIELLEEKVKHEEDIDHLLDTEDEIKERIESIKRQEGERLQEESQIKQEILDELGAANNFVFKRDDLSDKEVNILIEEGYFIINEFCSYERKVICALVKPQLNHSKTHTFLVWSIKKILEDVDGIKRIEEHLTKDADLTFEYNKSKYAIEIETGNLLRKKDQLKEKVAYLNRKYKNGWMFVVSHRDLLAKYRQFGVTAQRKDVIKWLEKLLKSNTQKKQV